MVVYSRNKGKRGELEVAELIREFGFEARRGQQFKGGAESADVEHNIPGVHVEVKRVEAFGLYQAMEQSRTDAGEDKTPTVFHRRSGEEWVTVLPARDFLQIMKEYCDMQDKLAALTSGNNG